MPMPPNCSLKRDPAATPPKEVPAILRDAKLPSYFRANLALSYAKALTGKRVYEEALESLKYAVPEQVVDPAAYYFHKAVAEHALLQKKDAANSIARLLDDVAEAPERYKMVATLMFFDMQGWKDDDKDLSQIARLMDNSERRLDLGRAGPKTQELQKKIVFRLDELIKDLENQSKNGSQCQCPGGVPQQGPGSNTPEFSRSKIARSKPTPAPAWSIRRSSSTSPRFGASCRRKERAKAMMEMTKDLPPRYREVIENYFKTLARSSTP